MICGRWTFAALVAHQSTDWCGRGRWRLTEALHHRLAVGRDALVRADVFGLVWHLKAAGACFEKLLGSVELARRSVSWRSGRRCLFLSAPRLVDQVRREHLACRKVLW